MFKTVVPYEMSFSEVFVKLAEKADRINELQPAIQNEKHRYENVFAFGEIG